MIKTTRMSGEKRMMSGRMTYTRMIMAPVARSSNSFLTSVFFKSHAVNPDLAKLRPSKQRENAIRAPRDTRRAEGIDVAKVVW